jgi:hypothetical protein
MKIPKNERALLTYVFEGVDCYTVTRNILGKYTLYKITDGNYQKIKTAESAEDFDRVVEKDRR